MKLKPLFTVGSLLLLGGAVAWAACGSHPRHTLAAAVTCRDDLTQSRVAQILSESPQEYVAAVQEVVDDANCYGPRDGSSCALTVRVVEYLGGEPGRPVERMQGWTYQTMEMRLPKPWPNRRIGRRRLVLAFPTTGHPELYGNRVFILDPTPEDIQHLRTIMSTLQQRS